MLVKDDGLFKWIVKGPFSFMGLSESFIVIFILQIKKNIFLQLIIEEKGYFKFKTRKALFHMGN